MLSCILLSAGESTRFGSPKALADLGGKTVIKSLQNVILSSSYITEIVIVLGAASADIKPFLLKHERIKVVYNKNYYLGQTSSFKIGVKATSSDTQGIFLLPVDFPLITSSSLDQLAAYFLKENPLILLPTYNGKKGHPPVFHAKLKNELCTLEDTLGINTVAQHHPDDVQLLAVEDAGVILSFNTPAEFTRICEQRND